MDISLLPMTSLAGCLHWNLSPTSLLNIIAMYLLTRCNSQIVFFLHLCHTNCRFLSRNGVHISQSISIRSFRLWSDPRNFWVALSKWNHNERNPIAFPLPNSSPWVFVSFFLYWWDGHASSQAGGIGIQPNMSSTSC